MNNHHPLNIQDNEHLACKILEDYGYGKTEIIADEKVNRFGKNKDLWYICFENFIVAGDWSGNLEKVSQPINSIKFEVLNHQQKYEMIEKAKKVKIDAQKEKDEEYKKAAIQAEHLWQTLSNYGKSDYLENKRLDSIKGIRFGNDENGNFIATALIDNCDKIWSIQFIYDNGFKKFLSDGKTKGCYAQFGNQESQKVFVCEGLATALSILLVNPDCLVVTAYNCHNLKEVTNNILLKYPNKKVIIAGDNDIFKEKNIGKEKAEETAKEFGLDLVLPTFKDTSSKPSDFDDLRQIEGLEEAKKQLNNLTSTIDLMEWEQPILFDEYEVPEISSDILPSPLKEFSKELANSTETPEGMNIMAILSVLSSTLQGKFEVKSRQEDSYSETLNIYTLTALPPANRKSSVSNACTKPLVEWEREQREFLEPEFKKEKSRHESNKKLIDEMRKRLKSDGDNSLIEEIAQKESELQEPEALPRLFLNDATPESLTNILAEQKGRMSVFSDEGGIIATMAGLYSGGNSNIDVLLKGWDGGFIRQKRKDRELDINPLLTINLTVQPIIIQNLGNQKAYAGRGLLERFLYCLPKSTLGYRTNDKPSMADKIKNDYHYKIRELLNIPYQETPITLSLDNDAFKEWREFQDVIEVDLRADGRLSICQGWGGKICGYALRIAGLLHIAQYGQNNTKINIHTIKKSLELCSLLTYHTIAAFGLMEIDPETKDVKEILRWIIDNKHDSFTKAALTKKMQNKASMKADRLNKLLDVLSQRNIISSPIKEGKKVIRFITNPSISDQWREL